MSTPHKKQYITTAIAYVNAEPHIGFALELVQADVIARSLRLGGSDVRFVTGTDENAIKNVRAAEKAGVSVADFIEKNAMRFKELTKELNISNDDFIRTSEPRHTKGAQKLWKACEHDLYPKEYEGLYCVGCEQFYLEKDLVSGLCPEHKTKPEHVKENNYFFKLSKYETFLKDAFRNGNIRIHPKSRENETINFIGQGLEDFSVSRSNERAKNWGVGVPGDPSQKMYVWFDALSNYTNALGYADDAPDFKTYWLSRESNITHIIGKGITRFHAIYWPAMLESAGIFPPGGLDIFIHGYVTVGGEKISKSLGNVVDPFALVQKYGVDAVRYFLLREIPTFEDGDFTEEKFKARYTGDLANGLGNLVQRVATLDEKNGLTEVDARRIDVRFLEEDVGLPFEFNGLAKEGLHTFLARIWSGVTSANRYVDAEKPWQIEKSPLRALENLTYGILMLAAWLGPFLPKVTESIFSRFGLSSDVKSVPEKFTIRIKKGDPLFPRLS